MTVDSNMVKDVLKAIQSVVGQRDVSLHEPSFKGNEWKYLKECLDSNFVSSVGKFVDQFEYDIAKFTGSKYAICVINGTSALHIALLLAGVRKDDEVLMPAFTFVATANAATYCGAIPHFVEAEISTLGIDVGKLRTYLRKNTKQKSGMCVNLSTGRVIRAIVPMHTFGHPSDLAGLLSLANEFGLSLIEDAAEALGSYYKGRHVGTFGLFGVLSFNGNKTITTGAGGAILTNNEEFARKAKHITTTAKIPHDWNYEHDEIGYNYRMANVNAAIGCAQLEQVKKIILGKRNLYFRYLKEFLNIKNINLITEPNHCQSNYWLQALLLGSDRIDLRDEILEATNDISLMTRPAWKLMHELTIYKDCPRMELNVSESLCRRLINIPSSSFL